MKYIKKHELYSSSAEIIFSIHEVKPNSSQG